MFYGLIYLPRINFQCFEHSIYFVTVHLPSMQTNFDPRSEKTSLFGSINDLLRGGKSSNAFTSDEKM